MRRIVLGLLAFLCLTATAYAAPGAPAAGSAAQRAGAVSTGAVSARLKPGKGKPVPGGQTPGSGRGSERVPAVDSVVGDWKLVAYIDEGEEQDVEYEAQYMEPFVISADGTFTMGEGEDDYDVARGTWEKKGDRYELTANDIMVPAILSENGSRLTMIDEEYDIQAVFERR